MSNSTIESLASSFFYGKKVPIEVLLKPNDALAIVSYPDFLTHTSFKPLTVFYNPDRF